MFFKNNFPIINKILSLLTPTEYRGAVILLFLMMVSTFLETLGVGLIVPIISILTENNLGETFPMLLPFLEFIGNPEQKTLIVYGVLSLVFTYTIKNFFLAFFTWRQANYTFNLQIRLSHDLFESYLHQPYTFHLQKNSAELFRNITGEVAMFVNGGISTAAMLINEMMVILGIGILLLVVEPMGTIIVVSVLGLAGWYFNYITKQHIANWAEARQYHEGLRIQHLQQGLNGVKDVKILGRELEFLEQHRIHHALGSRTGVFLKILQSLPRLWLELLAVCGLTVLVLTMLLQGRELGEIMPILGVFAVAGFRILPSIGRLLNSVQTLRFSLPAINTLYNEINLFVPFENTSNQNNAAFNKFLEFQNVYYTYPKANKHALNGISLKVKQGGSVGIIGNSGAGKTTFVDVLLGLLTPEDGKVLIDDCNIQGCLRRWQDQIGYVPQSIYLSDDTLRNNIAFGIAKDNIDEDAVLKAIHAAQLEEHVDSLADGLNTMIGEHGVRLSGGQRQRVGIARALYHDPSILVLDEATSSLDKKTESGVMEAVYALQGSKTVIIVAHRLSTIEHCDYLYKLGDGHVIDQGKPNHLLYSNSNN